MASRFVTKCFRNREEEAEWVNSHPGWVPVSDRYMEYEMAKESDSRERNREFLRSLPGTIVNLVGMLR